MAGNLRPYKKLFDFPDRYSCYTQGDTYEEVLENIKDAMRLHIEDRIDSKNNGWE